MQMDYYTKEGEAKPTTDSVSKRLAAFEHLLSVSVPQRVSDQANTGRNVWTRSIGACVIITADGGGPARVAKVGALALASSASALLLPLAVDCYPAIEERHKWDRARINVETGAVRHA